MVKKTRTVRGNVLLVEKPKVERKSKNTLTRKEARQVEDYVLEEAERIQSGAWTQTTFAEHLTNRMKRPVTKGNVQAASRAMEVYFIRGGGAAPGHSLKEMRCLIQLLAREVANIRGELGLVVNPTLQALAEEYEENNNI